VERAFGDEFRRGCRRRDTGLTEKSYSSRGARIRLTAWYAGTVRCSMSRKNLWALSWNGGEMERDCREDALLQVHIDWKNFPGVVTTAICGVVCSVTGEAPANEMSFA